MLVSTYIVKFMPSCDIQTRSRLTDMECGQHGLVELERLRASRRSKQNFLDDCRIPVRPFDYIVKAGQPPVRS
jgi:hypothetical protein